jgi:hypothetical protein
MRPHKPVSWPHAKWPPQRLFNRQCCKQRCRAFTVQSFRRRHATASGISEGSGHAGRNDGLCDNPQTVEWGGNARHGSVPDVERLPLVTAPMMRSSIGDDRSFRWGSGTAFSKGVPDDFLGAKWFAEKRALRNTSGRNRSFLLAIALIIAIESTAFCNLEVRTVGRTFTARCLVF